MTKLNHYAKIVVLSYKQMPELVSPNPEENNPQPMNAPGELGHSGEFEAGRIEALQTISSFLQTVRQKQLNGEFLDGQPIQTTPVIKERKQSRADSVPDTVKIEYTPGTALLGDDETKALELQHVRRTDSGLVVTRIKGVDPTMRIVHGDAFDGNHARGLTSFERIKSDEEFGLDIRADGTMYEFSKDPEGGYDYYGVGEQDIMLQLITLHTVLDEIMPPES